MASRKKYNIWKRLAWLFGIIATILLFAFLVQINVSDKTQSTYQAEMEIKLERLELELERSNQYFDYLKSRKDDLQSEYNEKLNELNDKKKEIEKLKEELNPPDESDNESIETESKEITTPITIKGWKAVSFRDYSFMVPSDWNYTTEDEDDIEYYHTFRFYKGEEKIGYVKCPIVETGFEFEMDSFETEEHYFGSEASLFIKKMWLMTPAESVNIEPIALIMLAPDGHDEFNRTCQLGGRNNFEIFRNIYKTIGAT